MPDDLALALEVDRVRCMGTGTCMVYAPSELAFDGEGKAKATGAVVHDLDAVRAAVESCPTMALAIVETEHPRGT